MVAGSIEKNWRRQYHSRMNIPFLHWLTSPRKTSTSVDEIQWDCKTTTNIGVDEVIEWQDWSERPTTADQSKIEAVIEGKDLQDKALLHVGVGNSGLAQRFCARAKLIDGISIQQAEITKAQAMKLNNYRAILCNKFSIDLAEKLGNNYDLIIDNNPSAFACCRKHFYTMVKSYVRLLKPGGEIITDELGLGWSTTENDPKWRLTPEDWIKIGTFFDLQPVRYNKTVLGLRRTS